MQEGHVVLLNAAVHHIHQTGGGNSLHLHPETLEDESDTFIPAYHYILVLQSASRSPLTCMRMDLDAGAVSGITTFPFDP